MSAKKFILYILYTLFIYDEWKEKEGFIPVIIQDGVESMGNGQHSAIFKLFPNGLLDKIICFHIHGCCSLIQDKDFWFTEQSPT